MTEPARVPPLLIPNLAAEEGAVWEAGASEAIVRSAARLWRLLFGPDARTLGDDTAFEDLWPSALGPRPAAAAFPEFDLGNAYAWLHTRAAATVAAERDYTLAAPGPDAVERVHDKAFALRGAQALGFEPAALRGLSLVLEPDALREAPDAAVEAIREQVARWPAWTAGRFVLKPRFGSSGRGRVSGRGADGGDLGEHLLGALPRLAERGGAILEPWVDRIRDLSAQLWIEPDGGVRLLGTTELLVSPAGVYRGHRGSVDNRGRVTSLCDEDESLREAAALLAVRAAQEGFAGPCGVDAFTFRGPEGEPILRPLVEWNARSTMGTVAIGVLRRALPTLRRELPRDAGERRVFHFALAPPEAGWPEVSGEGWRTFHLGAAPDGPALVVATDPGCLELAFHGGKPPSMLPH